MAFAWTGKELLLWSGTTDRGGHVASDGAELTVTLP
jgi:hypothetical protein